MKIDPIIAVNDVEKSSAWYLSVFEWSSKHGGNDFDVLVSKTNEIVLCLHKWGQHDHPTMQNPSILPGNGLILYFRTRNMKLIRQNLVEMNYPVEIDVHLNSNSQRKEFSLIDPNGYYLTISELHTYGL